MSDEDQIPPVDPGLVLRRAIELDRPVGEDLSGDVLDHQALAEVAAEIGVSQEALAAAVADGKAGILVRRTIVDRIVGPRWVWASGTVAAGDDQARERLVRWLSVGHGLRPRVRPDGVIVARKRRDLAGKLGAGVRKVQGLGGLASAKRVRAAAVPTMGDEPAGSSSLCLAADLSAQRRDAIAGGSAAAIGVSVMIGAAAFATGPALLAGLPLAAGIGAAVARRSHRITVVEMSESVDHTVEGVVKGEDPPRPIGDLVRRRSVD